MKFSELQTTLAERLHKRLTLAMAAFDKTRKAKPVSKAPPPLMPASRTVGWLYPLCGGEMERFALSPGLQYLTSGRTAGIVSEPVEKAAVKIEVLKDRIEVSVKDEEPRALYHGDKLIIGSQTYRLAMLPTRATSQALRQLFSIVLVSLALAGPWCKVWAQEVSAHFRESFMVREALQGLSQLAPDQVQAHVLAQSQSYPIRVRDVQPAPTHFLVLYDGSVLCSRRKMEVPLNQEIGDLLQKLDRDTRLTLVRYDRKAGQGNDGHIDYQRVFPAASKVGNVRYNGNFVMCNSNTLSVNGLAAIAEIAPQIFVGPKGDQRRAVLLFSPGNVSALPAKAILDLKNLSIDYIHTFVFSPVETESVQKALADFGVTTWWKEAKPINVAATIKYGWDFYLKATLPTDLDEGTYRLLLQIEKDGKPLTLDLPFNYGLDRYNIFVYRAWHVLLILLVVLTLGYGGYRVVCYYLTKHCPAHGHILSRKWNDCVFCARDQYPLLLVERGERTLEKAFVIKDKITRVGGKLSDNLHLKGIRGLQSLRITRVLSQTYELSPERGEAYSVNGEGRLDSVYLKHGDRLELGPYRIVFLFPKENFI